MRSLLLAVLLLVTTTASAQTFIKTNPLNRGAEEPRSEVIVYSSQSELDDMESLKFYRQLTAWQSTSRDGKQLLAAKFSAPFAWNNRQAFLHIERAQSKYQIYVNGKSVAEPQQGVLPSEVNITKHITLRTLNTVEIELLNENKQLNSWNWRDSLPVINSYVTSQPTLMVRDVESRTTLNDGTLTAQVSIAVKSHALNHRTSRIHYELLSDKGEVATYGNQDVSLSMGGEDSVRFSVRVPKSLAWSAENPHRYTLITRVQESGRYIEYARFEMGFRSIEVDNQGNMIVNGEKTELVAREVESNITCDELVALKDAGVNTIKSKAEPLNRAAIELADILGIYVVATLPINTSKSGDRITKGGNASNNPALRTQFIERVYRGVHNLKLHPSIIAYNIADHSLNGYNLYESYLFLKKMNMQEPIIYLDAAGEWNNDKLNITTK